ncbi:MAG TPA: hypothetical protein VGF56_07215 [Rhizomicrobium sp.]|jgi:hypothetical protein
MSDDAVSAPAPQTDGLPFEQALYESSPLGLVLTTLVVFAAMYGSFLAIAALEHVPTIEHTEKGVMFSDAGWPALVLTLLCTSAMALQRYMRLAEARDAPAYARILSGGMASASDITGPAPRDAKLGPATLIGILFGIVVSVVVRVSELREGHVIPPVTMGWYAAASIFLVVLFARGVAQSRAGGRSYARVLNAELKIDLLRTNTLTVLGRSAARSALIWFVISAIACLFFVRSDLNWLTILLAAGCAVMGISVFVSIMSRIHRQILAVKTAELEHVRAQIDAARAVMHADTHAAARLHGMLAYEKRIADAAEWPFDQSTLVRIAAYILIPTVPWFGQAVVQYFVDHLAHG